MALNRFTVVLDQNEGSDVYTLTVPALPGCITEGRGIEAALGNAREAIAGYPEVPGLLGEPVPVESDALDIRTVKIAPPNEAVA